MKNNLFGSMGRYIKGNALVIILAIATVVAGALSFNTIKDINNRLDSQKLENPDKVVQPSESQPPEQTEDVQNNAENVPLKPSATQKPKPKATPKEEGEAEQTDAEAEINKEETKDSFVLPIDSKIVAAFSGEELVYNTTMGDWRTHNGIDIKASRDTAVKACCDGVVEKVYNDDMLGWVAEIKTQDFTTRYCGLSEKVFVKQGDKVTQGQSIGTVGEIPLEISADSHLHLEVIKNDSYQNPDEYLRK